MRPSPLLSRPLLTATALVPLLVLALFSFWCGTFAGVSAWALTTRLVLLLSLALVGARRWRDPLAVGALLPAALVVLAVTSLAASPVPRAGLEAIVLLPALLLVAPAAAHCWSGERQRSAARLGLTLLLAAGAVWALFDLWWRWRANDGVGSLPRAAMPLGHHNLLAAWLVGLLPIAAIGSTAAPGRWLGRAALGLGLIALVLTRSLSGYVALGSEGILMLWLSPVRSGRRRSRLGLGAAVGLLLLALSLPRLGAIVAGDDASVRARLSYAGAAAMAFGERPALGWGPGATRWLMAEWMQPEPGTTPPGQVVSDLHSAPLQILVEIGTAGLLLFLGCLGVFLWRRLVEIRRRRESLPSLRTAAVVALSGVAIVGLTGRFGVAPALPVLLFLLAGLALPAANPTPSRWPVALYVVVAGLLLWRPVAATWYYDLSAGNRSLARAVQLDPTFPLYRARLAWSAQERGGAAAEARRAAADARSVPPLWLAAGILGSDAGAPWAAAALRRACALDPLSATAPFHLARLDPASRTAARSGAHALLADPRLGAALFWDGDVELFAAAIVEVETWPGLEPEWRHRFVEDLRRILAQRRREQRRGLVPTGDVALTLSLDESPALAPSLHVFRRRAWPVELSRIELRSELVERLDRTAAGSLSATAAGAFRAEDCAREGRR